MVKGVAEFMATGIEEQKTHLIAGVAMQLVDAAGDGAVVGGIHYRGVLLPRCNRWTPGCFQSDGGSLVGGGVWESYRFA